MKPTKARQFRSAYEFFLARAGFSWKPDSETREAGRRRCARALAQAEHDGTALGLEIIWEDEPDADRSWLDTEDWDDEDRACAEFYCARVIDETGATLASLGGIHEDIRDPIGARYYRRVVRAELFDEALTTMKAKAITQGLHPRTRMPDAYDFHDCAICGRAFASLLNRDAHSFKAHGTEPGSTIARKPECARPLCCSLQSEPHSATHCISWMTKRMPAPAFIYLCQTAAARYVESLSVQGTVWDVRELKATKVQ